MPRATVRTTHHGFFPKLPAATGKFLRDDMSFQTIAGGGDALTANPLSQFAATTSAQLAGVISDETGSGKLVFGTSPVITTPTGIVKADVGLGNVANVDTSVAGNVVVTTQNIINTTNLDTAITNLDDSLTSNNETGFGAG